MRFRRATALFGSPARPAGRYARMRTEFWIRFEYQNLGRLIPRRFPR